MLEPIRIGRYSVFDVIAAGGMASVHFGRFTGPGGFARTVAVKRMHPHLGQDAQFIAMFVDEARLAAQIRHPNVVATLDVLAAPDELLIVMEYVHGEALSRLLDRARKTNTRLRPEIACAIVCDVLEGLHAAHDATDERGQPLGIVHRDVSPENVLVGADGTARLLDFGVAKAVQRLQVTREGQIKGKIAYMAPEQVRGQPLGRTTDVYSASVVLWEMLAGRPLFAGDRDADIVEKILFSPVDAPTAIAPHLPERLNDVVLRGLARTPTQRFATARDMARAIRDAVHPTSAIEVGDWLESVAGDTLLERSAQLARIERSDVDIASRASDSGDAHTAVLPMAPTRARRDVRRPALIVAGVLGLIVLGVTVRASKRTPYDRASVLALPRASAMLDGSTAPLESTPAASATASNDSSPPPVTTTTLPPTGRPSGTSRRVSTPPTPARRPALHDTCAPPYTTDAEGTRRYKLECL